MGPLSCPCKSVRTSFCNTNSGLRAYSQSRNPPVLPLSLTLSGFPSSLEVNSTPTLHHVLSLIFPLVTTLPLSLSALNRTSFCPESKDEDLHSGWLQHPKGSVMMLSEGTVTEGEISSKGTSAFTPLGNRSYKFLL